MPGQRRRKAEGGRHHDGQRAGPEATLAIGGEMATGLIRFPYAATPMERLHRPLAGRVLR